MKKFFISIILVVFAILTFSGPVMAEWKPSGPIKLMIAFGAGGGADTIARAVGSELQARHGWEIIPQQVTGGGGVKMAKALAAEPNDGTAIGMAVTESYGYNLVANPGAGVTLDDVTPLTTVAGFQMGVVSKSSKGWNTIDDMFAAAKAGETIRFGVMSARLADLTYLLGKANNVEFNIVEMKGGKAVMNGINAGDIDVGYMAGIQAKGVASGDLVNLASGLSTPLTQTPNAPLLTDRGIDFNSDGYFLFTAPANLPVEAREAITDAIVEIVNDTSTKAGGIIKKALGGSVTIKGAELEAFLSGSSKSDEALMKAAK